MVPIINHLSLRGRACVTEIKTRIYSQFKYFLLEIFIVEPQSGLFELNIGLASWQTAYRNKQLENVSAYPGRYARKNNDGYSSYFSRQSQPPFKTATIG